jgi:acetyltransferase-like isoleucine patch superfamily enzyme
MLIKKLVKYLFNRMPTRLRCFIQSKCFAGSLSLGRGSYIHPSVHLLGKDSISLGDNVCVSEGCWLNVNHKTKNKVSIEIGNNCFIGKHNFFTSGDSISIGDYTLTTIGCRFISSSHNVEYPEMPYLITGTTCDDRIQIGVNCFLGAGVTVLGNVNIGHGSVIGSNSFVLRDIPPFSIAIGNPAKVHKRYSFIKKIWLPASEITEEEESAMPNELDYLDLLKTKYPHINMPWIAAGKSMGDL